MKEPKVFISYSWNSVEHQSLVEEWAERLIADGIGVILDIYDLKEGNDKYAFMERMVTDPKVTHVLIICDSKYSKKADGRKSGVGTESQIISKEVYEKVKQSKFIPIVSEFSENGDPYLPTFLKSRIWIDFSTPESVNENWERLVRLLYGKPLHQKPKKGNPPSYITNDTELPANPFHAKFNTLRQAILQGKNGIPMYRREFLNSCINYIDNLRVREAPKVKSIGEKVLEDSNKLKQVRDYIIDWILLEGESNDVDSFTNSVINLLEQLLEMKSRPTEVSSWNETWFEAHSIFVYETFLYIISSLIKTQSYKLLHDILTTHFIQPETERNAGNDFCRFSSFYGTSETLQSLLAPEGRRLFSPAAELIKRQSNREDIPFKSIMEADLLVLLMASISSDEWWYPQTLHYAKYFSHFPFFLRATQHRHFKNLSIITGIDDANILKDKVKEGFNRLRVENWNDFGFRRDFWQAMNIDKLDTII